MITRFQRASVAGCRLFETCYLLLCIVLRMNLSQKPIPKRFFATGLIAITSVLFGTVVAHGQSGSRYSISPQQTNPQQFQQAPKQLPQQAPQQTFQSPPVQSLPPAPVQNFQSDPYAQPQTYSSYQGPQVRDADLVIDGYPARTGRIMLGGAVNSDAGVTGQVTIDERNFDIMRWPRSFQDLASGTAFRGAGQTFRIEMAPGTEFKRYTASFVNPNIFGYQPVSMSVSGFLFDRRFNDWNEERLGGRLAFGYRITPDLSVSAGISGQNVNIETNRGGPAALTDVIGDNEVYSGEISLTHDTRNSPIQASEGHYFEFSFEEAFGDFDYARFETEFRQYWLVTERADKSGKQTISYSTQLGFSGEETPIFENFFAGGYATLRGFDFRGASPVDPINGVETGGRFQWLNSVEYMFPITADDAFRGVAFVDFGTVEDEIKIDSDNFRVAPGVGLRVAIPMLGPAPLAFDFAIPVAKAETDDERVFSFYMSLIR
ncbi:outer membrane protein assembly factor YaeT [Rubripirellula obstinata]|uniref:Outer membrane protein assembly factor YaeT n=1 Tax=Rubripirellula obstinata TaxID=406547 RepID=A0A5B1CHI0_9BACT|nr:outer membrane protein assembly factor [Rubripirellula obstinata]KAA1258674.1 outer membrane protein assembly factor YaeT [Rubripirellula obstinata]